MKKIIFMLMIITIFLYSGSVFAQDTKGEFFFDAAEVSLEQSASSGSMGGGGSSAGGGFGGGSSSGGSSGGGGSSSGGSSGSIIAYSLRRFQGNVYLPDGEVAPEGGIRFSIRHSVTEWEDVIITGNGGIGKSPDYFTIPEGENHVQYSALDYVHISAKSIAIRVNIQGENYGYMNYNFSDVTELGDDTDVNADIYITKPTSYINGKFTLGDSAEVLETDLSIDVSLINPIGVSVCSEIIILPAGQKETDFSLPALIGEEYTLVYTVKIEGISQQHISDAKITFSDTIYTNSEEVCGIVLEPMYRETVSGTITLPEGLKAPEGGLDINVWGASGVKVTIPENQSSVNYIAGYSDSLTFRTVHDTNSEVMYKRSEVSVDGTKCNVELEPCYTIYGTIELNEAALDTMSFWVYAGYDSIPDRYNNASASYSISLDKGEKTVSYYMILDECEIGSKVNLLLEDCTSSEKYVAMNPIAVSNALTIDGYANKYCFTGLEPERTAEVVRGTIKIPPEMTDKSSTLSVRLENEYNELRQSVRTNGEDDTYEFVIYGLDSDISLYSGEYQLFIEYDDYTQYEIYYNGNEFSVNNKQAFTVGMETAEIDIVLPEPNLKISGSAIMPEASSKEMELELTLYSADGEICGYRYINILKDRTESDYCASFLVRESIGDYIIGYRLQGDDITPYYEGMELYCAENGYTDVLSKAKGFSPDNLYENVILDLSPLHCRSYIKGTITLPGSAVPEDNTFFRVYVKLTNGEREEIKPVRFNKGEASKTYSISIPDLYISDGWIASYSVGTSSDIPSAPQIPTRVIRGSDFSIPQSGMSSGGGGWDGVPNYGPYNVIPDTVVTGTNVYYADSGLVFDKSHADKIDLTDGGYDNVDFLVITTDMSYPRKIGGYFLSTVRNTVFTVQLVNYETKAVKAQQHLTCTEENQWYEFSITDCGDYVIKFLYDDKQYYYADGNMLSESIDEAYVISADSDPNQYGFDVYYENIKEYESQSKQRYLHCVAENIRYGVNVCLYADDGSLLCKSDGDDILNTENIPVYIGIEYGGQKRFFTGKERDGRFYTLSQMTSDIEEATPYVLPHITEGNIRVYLDGSEFICGQSIGEDVRINESYFVYRETENGKLIEGLYIDADDKLYTSGGKICVALCGKEGELIKLLTVDEKPEGNTVPINAQLPHDGYIKLLAWESNLKPMLNVVSFFK